ncbi:hypothetical protein Hypma_005705 [Hypsizygus marmoreus]|uniref:Uncharacterized protein n=1 Tax=Hypsizygus marmoreus TaxID=39966 RepID=A0A369K3Q3_HYPMA|nr:hypothetical protein Hypma_005705 [Hypsizygus marmoreus]
MQNIEHRPPSSTSHLGTLRVLRKAFPLRCYNRIRFHFASQSQSISLNCVSNIKYIISTLDNIINLFILVVDSYCHIQMPSQYHTTSESTSRPQHNEATRILHATTHAPQPRRRVSISEKQFFISYPYPGDLQGNVRDIKLYAPDLRRSAQAGDESGRPLDRREIQPKRTRPQNKDLPSSAMLSHFDTDTPGADDPTHANVNTLVSTDSITSEPLRATTLEHSKAYRGAQFVWSGTGGGHVVLPD